VKVGGGFNLTYCSNIHAGETWDEVFAALSTSLPQIRNLMSCEGAFAIGLRLSAAAARSLEDDKTLAAFRAFLDDGNYYVPTVNGFPYGAFHGTRVKERVYLPDWRSDERVHYTNRLARLLSILARHRGETEASISTVPGAFRAGLKSEDIDEISARILSHAAYLKRLCDDTGVRVSLAIEPEPACLLETAADAQAFFEDHLFNPKKIAAAARAAHMDLSPDDVRRHVGVCLDTCHMAVEFEDPESVFERLHTAGIGIYKVQLSSALRLSTSTSQSPQTVLGRFADDTYLHQVVTCNAGGLTRYTDLPDAFDAAARQDATTGGEWRVHCHVPIFIETLPGLQTTQPFLQSVLDVLQRTGACRCLEVETYTWDVLPAECRTADMNTAIARELTWVRNILKAH
jgi:sugar phosphate isomerase/epimerase